MKKWISTTWICFAFFVANAQKIYDKNYFYSPVAVGGEKGVARRATVINKAEALADLPLVEDSEFNSGIDEGLWTISQFLISTPKSDSGIDRLFANYNSLPESTQRSLLEVAYGLYPKKYYTEILAAMQASSNPKNFALAAAYVYRAYPTEAGKKLITQTASRLRYSESQSLMIYNLLRWIDQYEEAPAIPALDSLFAYQQVHKYKVIYSFQSKDRDQPGYAVVQNTDGTFARDHNGSILLFRQLARSASNLPWFLTDGSTPQGLFTITGTDISHNPYIGPTPNLQTAMMHEVNPPVFTHYSPIVFNAPPEKLYRSYFPENWQNWSGLMEAYDAGKIGRSAIIAHGSTVDPDWYKGKPYYPLTPTMGCLCALENWNSETGKIDSSDQLDLVNTFIETPGGKQGYLFVINVDGKELALTPESIRAKIQHFEDTRQLPDETDQAGN